MFETNLVFNPRSNTFVVLDIIAAEKELQKRWDFPYSQDFLRIESWESQTEFVKGMEVIEEVIRQTVDRFGSHKRYTELKNFTLNKWYNHFALKSIEEIFRLHPKVRVLKAKPEEGFFIDGIPFQLVVKPFNEMFSNELDTVKADKALYAKLIHENRGPYNALYLAVNNEDIPVRVLCELTWIKRHIHVHLNHFNQNNLVHVNNDGNICYADLLILDKSE
jgi:hypothetical protein